MRACDHLNIKFLQSKEEENRKGISVWYIYQERIQYTFFIILTIMPSQFYDPDNLIMHLFLALTIL